MRRYKLRSLLLLTSIIAVLVAVSLRFQSQPREYFPLEEIIKRKASAVSLSGASWQIHVAPDVEGPFRSAGDDWQGVAPMEIPPGTGAHGWVDSGSERRRFDHPGIQDVSFLVIRLENRDDRAAYVILRREDGKRTLADSDE